MKRSGVLAMAFAVLGCSPAGKGAQHANADPCADAPAGAVSVEQPWMRVADAGAASSAAYFTLCNQTDDEVSLIAVEGTIGRISLHETSRNDKGVVSMSPLDRIVVEAGGAATLAPGGMHLMMTALAGPISAGEKIPLTLHFSDGDSLEIAAEAKAVAGAHHVDDADDAH